MAQLGKFYKKIMQVIVNREELLEPLAKRILMQAYKTGSIDYSATEHYVLKSTKITNKTGLLDINFAKVTELLFQDINNYADKLITDYKKNYRPLVNWLNQKFPSIDIDTRTLLDWYAEPAHQGFIKNIAANISSEFKCILSTDDDFSSDVLIRNIVNNEKSLRHRLKTKKNFWFTDTGYTNFLESKGKPWHRLVRSHIHTSLTHMNFPADRLHLLPSMPRPWRNTGDKILVVESSDNHYKMFGTYRTVWRDSIVVELTKYSDRPIECRPKSMNRKVRQSVYDLLMSSDDYYCVISDSSAAAVEAVWAGVPIITLNTHITQPVARTQISDINNLYRGPIGDWLCALSYSQFSKREMINGTAQRIVEKYHV